jgi:hypothetical protein
MYFFDIESKQTSSLLRLPAKKDGRLLFLFLLELSLPWENLALDMLLVILISGSSDDGYNSRSDRAQQRWQVMVMVMKISLLSFQISSFLDDDGRARQQ